MPETANDRLLRLRNARRRNIGLPPYTMAQFLERRAREREGAVALRQRLAARPVAVPQPVAVVDEAVRIDEPRWARLDFATRRFNWGDYAQQFNAAAQAAAAPEAPPDPPPQPQVVRFDFRQAELQAVAATNEAAQPKVKEVKEEDEMPEHLANSFLVGCDPEFVVIDKPDMVLDARTVGIGQRGEVGYDHSGLMLEIRPEAAKGTYALLRRIKRIIDTNEQLKKVSSKKWRAGGLIKTKVATGPDRILTLGGHVHLDIPPVGYGMTDAETHNLRLSAMDRVTRYMEKLDILPTEESATRRIEGARLPTGSRYGQWGDWRTAGENEGNGRRVRMEYRTPVSWLYDQKAAYLLMTAIKLAAVSPQLAMDTLKVRNINFDAFKQFFEAYRHKDTNARRALESLLDVKNIKQLQADPDRDIRDAWKTLEF
jgi:hypothetical protein